MSDQKKETCQAGISFCVPVHNAKVYVEGTIASILAQDLPDFEIICVDDGSDDGSWEVLRRLSEEYEQIRIYQHETGRGVSHTRNRMIDLAKKKYVWFVDADDLLVPGAAGRVLLLAEEQSADVLFGRVMSFLHEETLKMDETARMGTGEITEADPSVPWTFFSTDQYGLRSCGIWNGPYRKAFLDANHLRFHEELTRGEDYTFLYEISLLPEKKAMTADLYTICYRLKAPVYTTQTRNAYYKLCVDSDIASLKILDANPDTKRPENRLIVRDYTVGAMEAIMIYLSRIADMGYVWRTLRYLKSNGYYPFRHVTNTRNMKGNEKFRVLAYEPVFRILYPIKYMIILWRDRKKA